MDYNQTSYGYNIDIIACIDGSAKMRPIIDEVKRNVLSFPGKFVDVLCEADKDVEAVRVKVIVFRDYGGEGTPMEESEFFELPEQEKEYRSFVQGIKAVGGGDRAGNALEAITLAIKSDWSKGGCRRRQAILVYTDSEALPLGTRVDCPGYPAGMPADINELESWWEGRKSCGNNYRPVSCGLVAFAPDVYPWRDLCCLNRYWPAFSHAGTDVRDIEMSNVFDVLVEVI